MEVSDLKVGEISICGCVGITNRRDFMYVSVCKNVIASNNKSNWTNPQPPIRVSKTASGKATTRQFEVGILDANGNVVATIKSTKDGKPIIKAGAKVVIQTVYPVKAL